MKDEVKYDLARWKKRLEDTKRHLEEPHSCSDQGLKNEIEYIEYHIDIAEAYEQGRADYGNEILNYATELELENGCIDHTENECGEWVTMTIDYSKWCELWWFIEKHKKLEEQSNEQR